MILAFALCATAAAFVGPSTPQKTTALQHHKVRSQVADLKIYREEIDWETGEVVKREVEETVDDLVAKQPVKLKYTYEERRGEEGQKLALPPVFGGVGAAIAVAAIAAQEPVAALFATPAVLGAAAFAVNELKPVPVTYVGNCVEINSASGAPDNSSLSHFSAMTWPSWLGRAVRNWHRHAIEQASRRWRGGRCGDSGRTRR